MRLAGPFGADANAHPFQRYEHRARHQPNRIDHASRRLFAGGQQIRILHYLFHVRGFLRCLPYDRDLLLAGNER